MNEKQKRILSFISPNGFGMITLSHLGHLVDIKNRQTVKYHLDQLEGLGHIQVKRKNGVILSICPLLGNTNEFVNIPIYGSVNCGPATILAEENLEGYLKVSPRIINRNSVKSIFALKASGDSMNDSKTNGGSIENGDFVIVDKSCTVPRNGDYVVSIIDGAANIKKFNRDGDRIVLISESKCNTYSPIFIHPEDNYLINGIVKQVIKNYKKSV